MGNWKKLIMGEKMPDKDDPQYKEKYKKDVDAGRRFAKWSKLDKAAASVQHFANNHTKAFLAIVFGIIFISFAMNLYRMGRVWSQNGKAKSAVEQQDDMLRNRHKRVKRIISSAHCMSQSNQPGFSGKCNSKQKRQWVYRR